MREIRGLEDFLRQAISLPDEGCPLPRPGEIIHHHGAMRIEKQPRQYRYDEEGELAERRRFSSSLEKLAEDNLEVIIWLKTPEARLFF